MMMWLLACTGGGVVLDDVGPGPDSEDSEPGGEHLIELSINEIMADNVTSYVDDDGGTPDWIELHNASDIDIDIEGFAVSDDFEEPLKSRISGSLVVPSGGFALLFANDGNGAGELAFGLDSDGEELGLYTPEGQAIDLLEFGPQVQDMALARVEDGVEGEWEYVFGGTPGESNED